MASSSARARARSSFSLCARYNCSSWRSSAARSLASRARRRSSVFSKEWTALLMAVFSSRRLRWFGEMGGQSRGAGAGSGGDGSGGSFLNGGVAFFRWVGGAGVGAHDWRAAVKLSCCLRLVSRCAWSCPRL